MRFDVYCDESRPEALGTDDHSSKLVIGSLWLPTEDRDDVKQAVHHLRNKHQVGGEFKWQKVSPSRFTFYEHLLDLFFAHGDRLRFRCIVVDPDKVDLVRYHENDQELGFYKFYYQLLHHWIYDFNEYVVFCDFKPNRDMTRLHVLQQCLQYGNLSATISNVQAVPSKESVLIQFADVLTGAASAKLNNSLRNGTAKQKLVSVLEARLGRELAHTWKSEQKFNVFVINPQGGW